MLIYRKAVASDIDGLLKLRLMLLSEVNDICSQSDFSKMENANKNFLRRLLSRTVSSHG